MSNRIIPSGFVKSVLHNGVGRYVCQLQRITLKFCKSSPSSIGMRDFIENELLEFTRANPGVVVYLQPRRHKGAKLTAEYLNGKKVDLLMDKSSQEEICQWIGHLRTRSGEDVVRLRKSWHTDTPSIQGIWTPMTNRDTKTNLTKFPSEDYSRFVPTEKSATQKLLELAQIKNLHQSSEPSDCPKENQ